MEKLPPRWKLIDTFFPGEVTLLFEGKVWSHWAKHRRQDAINEAWFKYHRTAYRRFQFERFWSNPRFAPASLRFLDFTQW